MKHKKVLLPLLGATPFFYGESTSVRLAKNQNGVFPFHSFNSFFIYPIIFHRHLCAKTFFSALKEIPVQSDNGCSESWQSISNYLPMVYSLCLTE